MSGPIRVMTERVMSRGFEPTVARLMDQVKRNAQRQPGLISIEAFGDCEDHHKHVMLSQWKSKQDYEKWLASEDFKRSTEKLNDVLDTPGFKQRIFHAAKEDIFLL